MPAQLLFAMSEYSQRIRIGGEKYRVLVKSRRGTGKPYSVSLLKPRKWVDDMTIHTERSAAGDIEQKIQKMIEQELRKDGKMEQELDEAVDTLSDRFEQVERA